MNHRSFRFSNNTCVYDDKPNTFTFITTSAKWYDNVIKTCTVSLFDNLRWFNSDTLFDDDLEKIIMFVFTKSSILASYQKHGCYMYLVLLYNMRGTCS